MQWEDAALILHASKFQERSLRVICFCAQHGVVASIAKAGNTSAQRAIYQPGNRVVLRWQARLEEHMGSISAELEQPLSALLMQNKHTLAALHSVCALLQTTLHEREPHHSLYQKTEALLRHMAIDAHWLAYYIRWELALLSDLGYGLDLTRCAVSGAESGLGFISPKTGRAVSVEAAGEYRDRLLALPGFLRYDLPATLEDLHAGLRLSGYFLHKWALEPHGKTLPLAREKIFTKLS